MCRLVSLLVLLFAIVGGIGAINSQAQTETLKPNQGQTGQVLPKKNNLTQDHKIIDGDIQVPKTYAKGSNFEFKQWPGGVVYYIFDENVLPANRQIARDAMIAWSEATKKVSGVDILEFREEIGQIGPSPIFIVIQNSDANNSKFGMQLGGQVMNINSWTKFVIAHEFGHALGLLHEQNRADRNNFVEIITENIKFGQADQFGIVFGEFDALNKVFYGPYDFDSVMHYGECAFSISNKCPSDPILPEGGKTIKVKDPYQSWQGKIGQRTHLSTLDGLTISFLYTPGNARFVDAASTLPFQVGSFLFPFRNLSTGVEDTPVGGTLWVQPGTYGDVRTFNKPMKLRAPLGGVTINPGNGVAASTTRPLQK